jgi:hypothetical protein
MILAVLVLGGGCVNITEPKLNILVIAGGHSFDTTEFVNMFSSFPKYTFDTLMQPGANRLISSGEVDQYDVLVFYDMWSEIDSTEMEGYYRLLEKGKGMVFLHHSLASYQNWDEYKNIIGGKYIGETDGADSVLLSRYMHDLDLNVKISRADHPVVRNLEEFTIHDEAYNNIWIKKNAMIVLSTDHPESSESIAWVNTYGNSMIVYIMLGHDKNAYENESFKRLLRNAMVFVNKQK